MAALATAFIKMRPNTVGFKEETDAQLNPITRELGTKHGKTYGSAFGHAFKSLMSSSNFKDFRSGFNDLFKSLNSGFKSVLSSASGLFSSFPGGIAGFAALAGGATALALALAPVTAALIPITIGFGGMIAAFKVLPSLQKAAKSDLDKLTASFKEEARQAKPDILKAMASAMKVLNQLMPVLAPLMKAAADATKAFFDQVNNWLKSPSGKAFVNWLKTDGPKDIKTFGQVMWNVAHTIGDIFAFYFKFGQFLDRNFKQIFTVDIPAFFDIFKQSARIAKDKIEVLFLQLVFDITGIMGKLPGPLGAPFRQAHKDIGDQLKKITSDVNDAVGKILGDIARIHGKKVIIGFGLSGSVAGEGNLGKIKFAKGTSGAPPGWAWVGEEGPELVKMRGGETVLPHGASMAVTRGFARGSGWEFKDVFTPSVEVFGQRLLAASNAIERSITRIARSEVSSGSLPHGPSSGSASVAQRYAMSILSRFGWGANQWPSLLALWNGESGWNANAVNPSSGAMGIPQALGHGHVFNLGDYVAQINWGLRYIASVYGSPSAAYSSWLSRSPHWYGNGGVINEPVIGVGRSGRKYAFGENGPETVTPGVAGKRDAALVQFTGDNYFQEPADAVLVGHKASWAIMAASLG